MRPFYVVKVGKSVIYKPDVPISKADLKKVRDKHNAHLDLPESSPDRTRALNAAIRDGRAAYIGTLS